ncbi:hypothetical protein [Paraburkholderia terrae]|uniref:Uncharacterized protein n=1 Tax=Paraburkholderia terrae TaxID=311230 RepID=A0ABN6JWT1_9BURK|nr:hypothetical protein [Paraburkholderia terrae]BCZ85059.1 hypothetical protein PTKU64_87340 [Paraburkholderia terrae]BDC45020.1 hypothetical protein PTKU15_83170 [Paraburkholderia terrae]
MRQLVPTAATEPDELSTHPDPLGPVNVADGAVLDAIERAAMVSFPKTRSW